MKTLCDLDERTTIIVIADNGGISRHTALCIRVQVVARYCGLHKVTRTEEGKFACDCKSYMKMQVRMTLRAQGNSPPLGRRGKRRLIRNARASPLVANARRPCPPHALRENR